MKYSRGCKCLNNLTHSQKYQDDMVPQWGAGAITRPTCKGCAYCTHADKGAGTVTTRGAHIGARPRMCGVFGVGLMVGRAVCTCGPIRANMLLLKFGRVCKMFESNGFLKMAERDNYEKGCYGPAQDSFVNFSIKVKTLAEILKIIENVIGCERDAISVNACDEPGRIDAQVMENDQGLQPTAREWENFKAGRLDLWACTYSFQFDEVTRTSAKFLECENA